MSDYIRSDSGPLSIEGVTSYRIVSIEADAARAAVPNPQRMQETYALQEALSKIRIYFFLNYCDAGINSEIAFASMERSPNLLPLL